MFETPLDKLSRSLLTGKQHISRRLWRESFRRTARRAVPRGDLLASPAGG